MTKLVMILVTVDLQLGPYNSDPKTNNLRPSQCGCYSVNNDYIVTRCFCCFFLHSHVIWLCQKVQFMLYFKISFQLLLR